MFHLKKNYFFFLAFVFLSCNKSIDNGLLGKATVLVLMEANNNLKYEAFSSINRMEESIKENQNLLIYINSDDDLSYILRIKKDKNPYQIKSDTIETFKKNKSNVINISNAISYTLKKYESIKGVIFWSHATSWAKPIESRIKTKSFGSDQGREIDIQELAAVTPSVEYIIFDACSMGSVEVLYEFKDKAKFIIASPTETIAESLPYHLVTPMLFGDLNSLKGLCKSYYDYYSNYDDLRKSATVALYKTDKLLDLSKEVKKIYSQSNDWKGEFDLTNVQRLDFTIDFPVPQYDFGDVFSYNFKVDQSGLHSVMEDLVLYKASTESFLGNKINRFSGLSIYVPTGKEDSLMMYYRNLKWYKDSGMSLIW